MFPYFFGIAVISFILAAYVYHVIHARRRGTISGGRPLTPTATPETSNYRPTARAAAAGGSTVGSDGRGGIGDSGKYDTTIHGRGGSGGVRDTITIGPGTIREDDNDMLVGAAIGGLVSGNAEGVFLGAAFGGVAGGLIGGELARDPEPTNDGGSIGVFDSPAPDVTPEPTPDFSSQPDTYTPDPTPSYDSPAPDFSSSSDFGSSTSSDFGS